MRLITNIVLTYINLIIYWKLKILIIIIIMNNINKLSYFKISNKYFNFNKSILLIENKLNKAIAYR